MKNSCGTNQFIITRTLLMPYLKNTWNIAATTWKWIVFLSIDVFHLLLNSSSALISSHNVFYMDHKDNTICIICIFIEALASLHYFNDVFKIINNSIGSIMKFDNLERNHTRTILEHILIWFIDTNEVMDRIILHMLI